MAAVASSHKLFYRNNMVFVARGKREHVSYDAINPPLKTNMRKSEMGPSLGESKLKASVVLGKHKGLHHPFVNRTSRTGKFCSVVKASSSSEKHLKSLESYLGKLHDAKHPSSEYLNQRTKPIGEIDRRKADHGLRSLENYLGKIKSDSENYVNRDLWPSVNTSAKMDHRNEKKGSLKNYMELKTEDTNGKQKSADEASDFYLIGVLASINIAVFLFEIATPVKNSNFELFSLPMIYGAKINNLILTGEWWRLVTPMFLVQD
ncbi:Rhomboid protease [Handroanthus impetiginosus]|uniref:Rhomboid protease n=1 Tax=Handroanthus impetiginosus TaxID=429701 RepID=A0A2G9G9N5_9LAMI|nr:Rhomboid protease [Handroanthus impetiginosus]